MAEAGYPLGVHPSSAGLAPALIDMNTAIALVALVALLAAPTAVSAATFEPETEPQDSAIACRPWVQIVCDTCDFVLTTVAGRRCTF